jgi:hypothetical protein
MTDDASDPLAAIPADEAVAVLRGPSTSAESLGHSTLGPTRGVWRVRGAGGTSAILKVVGPREDERADASRRPGSYQFWAREPAIFADGLPAAYREAGIRLPRLLRRFDRSDGSIALWLEDVSGRSGAGLSIADLGVFARRLGEAQGRIAVEGVPALPWLSRGFLREYAAGRPVEPGSPWRLEPDDRRWGRQTMAAIDLRLRDDLIRLQRELNTFLGWVAAAPRTIAHLDVWPTNVFIDDAATGGGDIVLIDWAFAGEGGLGEDVGNLVPDTVFDLLHPPSILADLDRAVFTEYVEGLRAAGWIGDERAVRLAMCASAVKYAWIAAGMLARSDLPEQEIYGTAPRVATDELFAVRAAVMRHLVGWADEARELAAALAAVTRG